MLREEDPEIRIRPLTKIPFTSFIADDIPTSFERQGTSIAGIDFTSTMYTRGRSSWDGRASSSSPAPDYNGGNEVYVVCLDVWHRLSISSHFHFGR